MITVKGGDVFQSRCEALVNPVNVVGVMGAGLAFQFRKRFPGLFAEYRRTCKTGALAIGSVHCWANPSPPPRWVINFPTKQHYRGPSRVEYVEKGLVALHAAFRERGIRSVAIPALGCGLGGLKFGTVLAALRGLHARMQDVEIEVYQPS